MSYCLPCLSFSWDTALFVMPFRFDEARHLVQSICGSSFLLPICRRARVFELFLAGGCECAVWAMMPYSLPSVCLPGKGGKNRRRGKNDNEGEKRELQFKEDGQGKCHFDFETYWHGLFP